MGKSVFRKLPWWVAALAVHGILLPGLILVATSRKAILRSNATASCETSDLGRKDLVKFDIV